MPSALEFDDAARVLRGVADDLSALTGPTRRLIVDGVLVGGRLTSSVETLIGDDESTGRAAGGEADALAAICTARAEVCRSYAEDLRVHRQEMRVWRSEVDAHRRHADAFEAGVTSQPPGPRPRRPTAPAAPPPWVD